MTNCECCGRERPTPWQYACLPHVRFDELCDVCAAELRAEVAADGLAIPDDDAMWYLRPRGGGTA